MTRTTVIPATIALAAALALAGCNGDGTADSTTTTTTTETKAGADAPDATADAGDLDPILAQPRVGDLWAADLTAFSGADFRRDGQAVEHAWGLLKVIAVTDSRVTVITETGFWPRRQGSINDLRGDLSDISWDESEEIPVNRSDLADYVDDDKIVEVRRLEGAAAAATASAPGKPGATAE